jgi:hypothetical protein
MTVSGRVGPIGSAGCEAYLSFPCGHVLEIPLISNSTHMTHEGPQDDGGAVHFGPEDVHFATIEEKKRLWFRDAIINALFIASWCVPIHTQPTSNLQCIS